MVALKSIPAIISYLSNAVGYPAIVGFDKTQDFHSYMGEKFGMYMAENNNQPREVMMANFIGLQEDGTFVFNEKVSWLLNAYSYMLQFKLFLSRPVKNRPNCNCNLLDSR